MTEPTIADLRKEVDRLGAQIASEQKRWIRKLPLERANRRRRS
jgi:hypothetical protein